MNYLHPVRAECLAAEYVLGTLHGLARRRFERLLPAHPTLQRAVAQWAQQINRLAVAAPPEPPPPQVWSALHARLFAPAPRRAGWWNRVALWRGVALASLLATVILLLTSPLMPLGTPSPADAGLAAIRGAQHEVLWLLAQAQNGQWYVSNPQAMHVPPDQGCFLWLKPADAPPVLIGALPDDGSSRILTPPETAQKPLQGALWVTMQPMTPPPTVPVAPLYQTRWHRL